MPAVEIFRAVKDPELNDIKEHRLFRASPYGSEGKYFALNMEDISKYARVAYKSCLSEGPYSASFGELDEILLSDDDIFIVDVSIASILICNEKLMKIVNIGIKDHMSV